MPSDPSLNPDGQPANLADVPRKAPDEAPGWTGNQSLISRLTYALFGFGAILLLIDPLVHKHGPFDIEHVWGFYGIYPMIGCAAFLIIARALAFVLRRSEDYYDR